MELMGQPFSLWTVIVFTFGMGGITLLTYLGFAEEDIEEKMAKKNSEETEATES